MDKEKRRLGYPTPTAEMQDKFLEITQLLDAEKISWGKLGQKASEISDILVPRAKSMTKSVKPRVELVALTLQVTEFAFLGAMMSAIAKLGEDVSETHKRLAKVEKAVNELKRALKA